MAVAALVNAQAPCGDVPIDLTLPLLPLLSPEPSLIRRDRQRRSQLDHAVSAFGDLKLGTGLIQMQALAQERGNR